MEPDLIGKGIGKNIEFAEKKGYKFVGIVGENEIKSKSITIKNIENGKQEVILLKDVEKIKAMVMG